MASDTEQQPARSPQDDGHERSSRGPMRAVSREMAIDLANSSPAHIMLLDAKGMVFDVNARSETLLSNTAAELRGKKPTEVFDAILIRVASIGHERAQRGFQLQYEGDWFEAQIFTTQSFSDADEGEFLVLRATNITDRKAAEFQLLESEARLEEATRIASMGTYKLYWDTSKVIWSHQMYEIHDVAPGSLDPSATGYNQLVYPKGFTHC